ncbi:MAG: pseudouridine-5'-phosphate glycosidase [Bacteroidota bacterium]
MLYPYLDLSEEVQQALEQGQAVVALESTIIAHGMPFPQNLETALALEAIIRKEGAIPATIAIQNGRLKAGMSAAAIEQLARKGEAVTKVSRRDLPFVIAQKLDGATTVAATMIIAQMAGIRIFATGGIGGVHRGATESMDISADLQELARTNVAVVCAGAKSVLDLGLTLEYLETHGVPVVGFQTLELPAFYTRQSGHPLNYSVSNVEELALVLKAKWDMQLQGGMVIANPIAEDKQMPKVIINQAIEAALAEAERKHISGKDITPFLLAKIERLTGGDSLQSNIQLVYSNARLAAQLARAYHSL